MITYYRVTAYTPYGAELTRHIATAFENELMHFAQGILADLVSDSASRWSAFDSLPRSGLAEWLDEFYDRCDVRIEVITYEEYVEETK